MMKKLTFLFLLIASLHAVAAEHLNGEQLKKVLVGNTETGVYTNKGQQLNYWEFYRPDGVIRGTEDKYGAYHGTYSIKADGCLNADYDGEEYDGCYFYTLITADQYSVTDPQGKTSTITIKKGDSKFLNQF
jgi:hypothetical protein